MNIFIKILPLILCLCFLAGCSKCNCDDDMQSQALQRADSLSNTTPVPQDDITYKLAGTDIYYAVLSSSSTECKINITTVNSIQITFGEMYHIERLVDGKFEKLEWKNEPVFIEIAYLIRSTDKPVEKTYKWKPFLGELESGTYRIVTDFYRDGEKINARFEFTVE